MISWKQRNWKQYVGGIVQETVIVPVTHQLIHQGNQNLLCMGISTILEEGSGYFAWVLPTVVMGDMCLQYCASLCNNRSSGFLARKPRIPVSAWGSFCFPLPPHPHPPEQRGWPLPFLPHVFFSSFPITHLSTVVGNSKLSFWFPTLLSSFAVGCNRVKGYCPPGVSSLRSLSSVSYFQRLSFSSCLVWNF